MLEYIMLDIDRHVVEIVERANKDAGPIFVVRIKRCLPSGISPVTRNPIHHMALIICDELSQKLYIRTGLLITVNIKRKIVRKRSYIGDIGLILDRNCFVVFPPIPNLELHYLFVQLERRI